MHPGILAVLYFFKESLNHPLAVLNIYSLLRSVDISDDSDNRLIGYFSQYFIPIMKELEERLTLLNEFVSYLLKVVLH